MSYLKGLLLVAAVWSATACTDPKPATTATSTSTAADADTVATESDVTTVAPIDTKALAETAPADIAVT